MIQVDNYIANPFFDDASKRKDGTFEFFPAAPKHQKSIDSHPELIEYLTCKDITMRTLMQGLFSLNNELLVFHENGFTSTSKTVIDLSFARLTPIPLSKKSSDYGFILMKNNKLYELKFKEKQVADTWIDALRKVCIFTNFHQEYELIKVIGKGSFANVCLAESLTDGSFYAVKRFQKEEILRSEREKLKDLLINEINVLRSLSHENIATLYEVHETQNSIYLVMEVVQGKPLHDIITRQTFHIEYTEEQIISLSYGILSALSYLSSKNIMHRDIKPDNILIQKNGKIVIIDFGLACSPRQSEFAYKICGSPGYIAPEVLKCSVQDKFSAYNEQCDVFSAGCILYYMLYGRGLFEGGATSDNIRLNSTFNYTQLTIKIKDEIYDGHSNINKRGLDLALKMLNPDPRNRINVYEALEHPYFDSMTQNKGMQSFKIKSIKSQVSTLNLLNKSTDVDWRISKNASEKTITPYAGAGREEMSFAQNDSIDTTRVFEREDSSISKVPTMKIGSAKKLHIKTKSDNWLIQKRSNSPRSSSTMNEMRSPSPKSSFHKLASRRNTGCPAGFLKAAIIRSIQTSHQSHQSMVYSFSDYANLATDPNEEDDDEMNDTEEGYVLAKSVKIFTRNQ